MSADPSAYAALGVDPGSDDAEIEQAYRRLIKQYHPDRHGGDTARATAINQAYRELRAHRDLPAPLDMHDDLDASPGQAKAWVLFALVLVAAIVFLMFRSTPAGQRWGLWPAPPAAPVIGRAAVAGPIDTPLATASIDRAVHQASDLRASSDEMKLASVSRECHRALRRSPSIVAFDFCAAFDDAVVELQDRDPLRDQGPFSELAVTGRIRSSAALLSDDSLAVDARLDRIRARVELALASTG